MSRGKDISVAEAKKNFAAAMDALTIKNIVSDSPFKSVFAACSAGVAVGASAKKIAALAFPVAQVMSLWRDILRYKHKQQIL